MPTITINVNAWVAVLTLFTLAAGLAVLFHRVATAEARRVAREVMGDHQKECPVRSDVDRLLAQARADFAAMYASEQRERQEGRDSLRESFNLAIDGLRREVAAEMRGLRTVVIAGFRQAGIRLVDGEEGGR